MMPGCNADCIQLLALILHSASALTWLWTMHIFFANSTGKRSVISVVCINGSAHFAFLTLWVWITPQGWKLFNSLFEDFSFLKLTSLSAGTFILLLSNYYAENFMDFLKPIIPAFLQMHTNTLVAFHSQ